MKVIRPLQLSVNGRVLEQHGKFFFTASVSLGFHLLTGETILDIHYLKDVFECMGDKPLPDMGMPKPCGEFLVSGSFHAPGGQGVTGGEVRVRLGGMEKSLYVFGPRRWVEGRPSTPAKIVSMPLDYAHAFGGKEYERNPDGIGCKDGSLPCVEDPARLIVSPDESPEPAGFAPLDPALPQRMRFQGSYDDSYREKYFPGYPPDFDWRYFLCAPQNQWATGYFKGDEAFEIHHMHPELPAIQGSLPELAARCFIKRAAQGGEGAFSELPMKLDTVWLFPEKLTGLLIWRAVTEAADDEAEDVACMLAAYEDASHEPRSPEHYFHALEKRLDTKDFLLNYFKTEDLIPPGAQCAMEILQEQSLSKARKGELEANLEAKAKGIEEMVRGKMDEVAQQLEKETAAAGGISGADTLNLKDLLNPRPTELDPDVVEFKNRLESILPGMTSGDPRKIQLKDFSFDKIDQVMDEVEKLSAKKQSQAFEALAKVREQTVDMVKKSTEEAGAMPPEAAASLEEALRILDSPDARPKMSGPLPRLDSEEIIRQFSLLTPQVMGAIQHLEGLKAAGGQTDEIERQIAELFQNRDRDMADNLRKAEESFKEMYMMGAHFMGDGLSPHKDPPETVAGRLAEAVARGENVSGGDWACIDLNGKKLDGVDLSGAYLEQVNFRGASLKGANLRGAILARANLEDADLSGADLEGANVGGVRALRTDFSGANLKSAKMSRGDFTDATFTGCELEGVESLEIVVNGADFSHAHMPGIKFIKSNLKGARFRKADLSTALFYDCMVSDVDFSGALLPGGTWADARLENVRFDGADLTTSCFAATDPQKAAMKNLSFVGACLNRCNFQGMEMQQANLSAASMENANFNAADLTGADLTDTQAVWAQFRKARLTDARLDRINLKEGSLAKANLVRASFNRANLYAVDFLRAVIGETDFRDSNLDATLFEGWRPK